MLIGFVSDERYVALPDVGVEFQRDGQTVAVLRSTPRGAVIGDIPPGDYHVTLAARGFGAKRVSLHIDNERDHQPYQFRLLADGLLGYVWPKWVRAGERGEFRVHSDLPYRLSLHRYGQRKEQVKLLGWFDEHGPRATVQITPDGDYTQTGVAWNREGYNSPHHTQFAIGPQQSGLYFFHAETEATVSRPAGFFAFPWIVAPAKPAAPIAVLASTHSWNAYNNFGGRSNYINASGLPREPIVNARQDMARYQDGAYSEWGAPDDAFKPLSFDRPERFNVVPPNTSIADPIRGRLECATAPAVWRLLGWLERERFAYDLYADAHLHDGSLDLDAYRVLVLDDHPEYWSRDMYQRVKSWVFERGGKLIYLGGNGLNCEVVFTDTGEMRCLSHDAGIAGNAANPNESRYGRRHESEANLLGVVFTDPGIMTGAPYRVVDPTHWVFEGTQLREGDRFGEHSQHERCHGGASGHETDERSPSSPADTILLARGENPEEGGADMVIHHAGGAPGAGSVFSVGSINWISSLWVDPAVSRITANVVRRFLLK